MAGVLGYFAYGNESKRSGRLTLEGLGQPAAIQWSDDGTVTVEAAGEADLFAALGYVHGADHAWAMTLWRQAALGHLSQWFGSDYVTYDRHARMLGFGELAREAYDALPQEEKALLDAYAAGANLALASEPVSQQDEFVLLDLEPEAWVPWHALAIERMIAWMGTAPLSADSSFAAVARADSALVRFTSDDARFRDFLHIGGADQSRAWTSRIGATTIAVQQLSYGNSALPLFREVTVRVGGKSTLVATVPGTLMLPAGQSDDRMWTVFLTSSRLLVAADSLPPPPLFDRLVDRDGNEALLTIPRSHEGFHLKAEPPAPSPTDVLASVDSIGEAAIAHDARVADSLRLALYNRGDFPSLKTPPAWLIRWPGFGRGSDLSAWRALLGGSQSASFALFRGDGLVISSLGESTVLGSPLVRRDLPGGLFVASDQRANFAADRLEALLGAVDDSVNPTLALDPRALVMDVYSPWASALTPRLIAQLGDRDSLDHSIKDAYAFLHGWDYRYDRGSIAASIFEEWMVAYQSKVGRLPMMGLDSSQTGALRESLRDAVGQIGQMHGGKASRWRWELVQPGRRFFPVWSDTMRGAPPGRFATITHGVDGHPTTVHLGPSSLFGGYPTPSAWTAWTLASGWDRTSIYHPVAPAAGFASSRLTVEENALVYPVRRDAEFSNPLQLRPRE